MAVPQTFEGVNQTWWGPGDIGDLPTASLDGRKLSCWVLTPEELEEVKSTGRVWLSVWTSVHPPVLVEGINPLEAE